ncbi:MAG: glycosyltransferase family 4 protein [Candidatus Moraniibacteriota bacterium]
MQAEKKLKILFISHSFPPVVGGVESQNYELYSWLSKFAEVKLIANRNRKLLPIFLPCCVLRAVWSMKDCDVLVLGSALLAPAGWLVKKINRKPVIAVAHGLDLTWKIRFYQKFWVQFFIPKLDKLIAVGNETIRVGIKRGIPEEKMIFIPNGVDVDKYVNNFNRDKLDNLLEQKTESKNVLLTSGRLARRKGVAWFVRNVMPQLAEDFIYVVAGNGPDKENILSAVKEKKLENRVFTLGYVEDEVRDMLFSTCDLFVQPNIRINGDMEGFGISVIEAGACEIPVLASDLEGLKDAIKEGQNGFLVEPENSTAYIEKINKLFENKSELKNFGKQAREFVKDNYSWEIIVRRYLEEIKNISGEKNKLEK